MVKVTIAQLLGMSMGETPPLGKLAKIQTFNAKTTYRAAKAIKAIGVEVDSYEKARVALCQKCGTQNVTNNNYDIDPAKKDQFQASLQELLDQTVELDIVKVELDDDATGLCALDMMALEPILDMKE